MPITNLGDLLQLNLLDSKKIIFYNESDFCTTNYVTLDTQAQYLAQGLIKHNISAGDTVAVVASNSIEFLTAMLGILKMGAVAVLIDSQAPTAQLNQLLTSNAVGLVFTDRPLDTQVKTVDLADLSDFSVAQTFESVVPDSHTVALMLHTSGSTGQPKTIKITHNNFLNRIQDRPPAAQTYMVTTPYHHMNGLFQMLRSLVAGCDLIGLHKFDAHNCLKVIDCCQVNFITSIPTVMSLLTKAAENNNYQLDTVKTILVSSAPMSQNLHDNVKRTFPQSQVLVRYGSTEGGPGIFIEHATLSTPDMSVGYPNPNIQYRLIDQVLQIRSPYMVARSEQNSQSFTSDGYFVTNDLFTVDKQGFYYFLGRADDMFVCGGQNIYPRHIESILESHSDVLLSAVIGIEDEIKGIKPYAFVTVKSSSGLNQQQLQTYMRDQLPANLCPRNIWIVDQLPTIGNDKIDRVQLKRLALILLG
jgi:acyl-coenzyme A synthetase/AMP-(fatty) acid ligase